MIATAESRRKYTMSKTNEVKGTLLVILNEAVAKTYGPSRRVGLVWEEEGGGRTHYAIVTEGEGGPQVESSAKGDGSTEIRALRELRDKIAGSDFSELKHQFTRVFGNYGPLAWQDDADQEGFARVKFPGEIAAKTWRISPALVVLRKRMDSEGTKPETKDAILRAILGIGAVRTN